MLDDLVGVIETLQQRIRTHGATLRANEIRTRTALIDPLLTALGWDVSDPALVTPEYAVGEGRADYALHGSESIPAAVIEAKRLGHTLNDEERMQMLNYANTRGVRYAAVTDGNVWELYPVFTQTPQPLEDRRLLNLRISSEPAHELVLKLLLLWRPNLASGQPVTAEEPLFNAGLVDQTTTPEPETQEPTQTFEPPSTGPTNRSLAEPRWVSLTEFNPPSGSSPPSAIRFPGEKEEKVISSWTSILVEVAVWLNSTGELTVIKAPVPLSNNSYLVHVEPKHPTGEQFRRRREIADGKLVINTFGSAEQMRNSTRRLLQHCGIDPATVHLQVEQ